VNQRTAACPGGGSRRRRWRWRFYVYGAILAGIAFSGWFMISMPGSSYRGPLAPLDAGGAALAAALAADVEKLAGEIGERNIFRYRAYQAAADFIEESFRAAGYAPRRLTFASTSGQSCWNLEVEVPGAARKEEIVIAGAHYDSVLGSPGANDNASGVAALLALARSFRGKTPARTVRFVAFANEELFRTPDMGSRHYARDCRARGERITAMVSLETMGYFSEEKGSQSYPFPFSLFYPATGNFIAFVGNVGSRSLVREAVRVYRGQALFPSEGGAVPGWIQGVGWSDHWSFWQEKYPGIMVTDTAPFRYPHYHTAEDTPDKVDCGRLARVVQGLEAVLAELAGR
jgi:hypothetical protein